MSDQGYFDRLANVKGRTAVLVGGGDGVGRGCSLALAEAGVNLAILDWTKDEMEQTAKEARDFGVKAVTFHADATHPDKLSAFFDLVEREFPEGIDILVNLVGGVKRTAFADTKREDWQHDIQRNFGYALESINRSIHLIRRKGKGGSIINFTTIEAHRGAASFSVYSASKAALANFTRCMAVELGAEGIRVNCVVPDTTPSKTSSDSLEPHLVEANNKIAPEQWQRMWGVYIPQGYCPPIEDLAKAVLYLASDLSTSVNGVMLHVDGGTIAAMGFLNWPFQQGYLPAPLGETLDRMYPQGDTSGDPPTPHGIGRVTPTRV